MSRKKDYYSVNPHGHTTKGIQWDGLERDGYELTLQEVIDAAKKEFPNVPFDKLLLFPEHGSFALGTSDRTIDQKLKSLSQLIKEALEDSEEGDLNKFFVISYMHGVFAEPEYLPFT